MLIYAVLCDVRGFLPASVDSVCSFWKTILNQASNEFAKHTVFTPILLAPSSLEALVANQVLDTSSGIASNVLIQLSAQELYFAMENPYVKCVLLSVLSFLFFVLFFFPPFFHSLPVPRGHGQIHGSRISARLLQQKTSFAQPTPVQCVFSFYFFGRANAHLCAVARHSIVDTGRHCNRQFGGQRRTAGHEYHGRPQHWQWVATGLCLYLWRAWGMALGSQLRI